MRHFINAAIFEPHRHVFERLAPALVRRQRLLPLAEARLPPPVRAPRRELPVRARPAGGRTILRGLQRGQLLRGGGGDGVQDHVQEGTCHN